MTHLLAAEIRRRINRLAHAAGVKHGAAERERLLSELNAMQKAGRRLPELKAHLLNLESEK